MKGDFFSEQDFCMSMHSDACVLIPINLEFNTVMYIALFQDLHYFQFFIAYVHAKQNEKAL